MITLAHDSIAAGNWKELRIRQDNNGMQDDVDITVGTRTLRTIYSKYP